MKALDMLKAGEIALLKGIELFGCDDKETNEQLNEVRFAISELELLLSHNTCDGCSYAIDNKPYDKSDTCNSCIRYRDKNDNYVSESKYDV